MTTTLTQEQLEEGMVLVRRKAKRLARLSNVPQEDLEQEGFIGLQQAAENWDHTRGPFMTVAHLYARREMVKAVKRQKTYDSHHQPFDWDDNKHAEILIREEKRREGQEPARGQIVRRLVERLRGEERAVVKARYGLEPNGRVWRVDEIADALDFSPSKVRRLLESGRSNIKRMYTIAAP